ncbi:malate synthase [Actinoplanes sp. SE50]|uniref:malate synthase A n=1 Tax=unclassified Actinoplanes TaxID=2626549 RepID=UPI00023ECEE9|nr:MULTISPECIES: malate synthase A [unclassified Actinoplanes]AEV86045.1 malate synthase [Actinoplanes sp. SE50/110]ATO84443.1 malate synthase [Actinoplanes sp. SE50]SLM01853.1 malate synthase A [Actinoplanes sp. SE50/110]
MGAEEITITGTTADRYSEILTPEAVAFVVALDREFGARRVQLLERRRRRRATRTTDLDFLPSTRAIRDDASWQVAAPAADLRDRRVEITGPPERKMTINALNSGAKVWMADFEDATSPTWENVILGQVNLKDALDGTLDWTAPDGRRYEVGADLPTIMVRPRGWHLPECHLRIGGRAVSASLFDFGLYLFHCGQRQIDRGSGPYFYLPKLESHLEARLWNDVFVFAQEQLGIPRGTIRATVLIETINAAFEMDEILYELREHSAGLNAGRWDYLFSMIKNRPDVVLPERSQVTMTAPFMRAYTELLVKTCHRRGAHAIGGMAAVVPSRDPVAAKRALNQVRQDKRREVGDGFDGSWVAHPALVETCREVFDQWLGDEPHQIVRKRDDVRVGAAELLDVKATAVAVGEVALRNNISVSLRYIASWLGGRGAVALGGLMEDAATAEICRAQLWQWISSGTPTDYGVPVTAAMVTRMLREELDVLSETGALDEEAARLFGQARTLLTVLLTERTCPEFLTLPAYLRHLSGGSAPVVTRATVAA